MQTAGDRTPFSHTLGPDTAIPRVDTWADTWYRSSSTECAVADGRRWLGVMTRRTKGCRPRATGRRSRTRWARTRRTPGRTRADTWIRSRALRCSRRRRRWLGVMTRRKEESVWRTRTRTRCWIPCRRHSAPRSPPCRRRSTRCSRTVTRSAVVPRSAWQPASSRRRGRRP